MPRAYGNNVESNFSNGLITEATGMNFPENALLSSTNVVVNDDGSVSRRLGIDLEPSYTNWTAARSGDAIVEYVWSTAGGDGDITFIVVQVGATITFYRVPTSGSLSAQRHATTVSLTSFDISGSPDPKAYPCDFASGKGYLFVTHRYCTPFYVRYNTAANTFSTSSISVRVRDFDGVDDSLSNTSRPNTLTNAHTYNLYNQGWQGSAVVNSDGDLASKTAQFNTLVGDYPSNADVWWLFLDSLGRFDPDNQLSVGDNGSSRAPKGFFILDPFDTNRSSQGAGTVTERESDYERPSCCAFFAGRIFYSGVKYSGYAGEIYFSQIIESDDQLGKCYQMNDPTSQHNSDLLPTDGGVIRILDAGEIYRMFPSQKALIVFASNGIWAISGNDATAFSAEEYVIRKIASLTIPTNIDIVDVLGAPVFWTQGAVWTVVYDQGEYVLQNASDAKIKTFLQAIPSKSVTWAKGYYNRVTGIVQWLYRSTAPTTTDEQYEFDSVLCLNTKTGAFYGPWQVTVSTHRLHGIISVSDQSSTTVIFKYLTSTASGSNALMTWAEERDTDYVDWDSGTEAAYSSEFESGYKVAGEGNKEFQNNYVVFHLADQTNASAFVQGCWDFSNSNLSKKWTTAQQIYNSIPTYRDFRMRKVKIRGWGKALNYRVYSEAGKPFKITGWSAFISVNQIP